MSKFTLSPEAIDDLELIWTYIARDNGQAADAVIEAAYRVCGILGEHPGSWVTSVSVGSNLCPICRVGRKYW